ARGGGPRARDPQSAGRHPRRRPAAQARAGRRGALGRVHGRAAAGGDPRQPHHRDAARPRPSGHGPPGAAQPPPAARAGGAPVAGAGGGAERPDPPPLRSEPAAHPGRRGPPAAGLPQPRAQRHRGHARGGATHPDLAAVDESPLHQGGSGRRAAQHGRGAGGGRGRGHSRGRACQALHPLLHHQGQGPGPGAGALPPNPRGASGRHPGRQRAGARHHRVLLHPPRAMGPDPMSTATGQILIADDEDGLRWVLEKGFRGAGYTVTAVKDGTAALREAEANAYDLVLLDIRMPGIAGLPLLRQLPERRPDALVVIMTAHGTMETAISAIQQGAYDYLAKPFDIDEALLLGERALAARRLTQEVAALRTGLREVWEFGALGGGHPTMQEVYKTIGRVAASDVSVLLRGESGTGKEVVARALHHYSRRAGRPFVGISAAAIPGTLLESELFGHEKGAFTDAKERRLGKLELAHGGSVFFDEI